MKAFYVVCNGYDAILIPETNQCWFDPRHQDMELFASSSPNFIDWEGAYEEALEGVEPNIISVRRSWETTDDSSTPCGDRSVVVAESDDGALTVFDKERWNRKVEEAGLNLPKSA